MYTVLTPNASASTAIVTRPIFRRLRSAEDSDPLDDRAPVRWGSSTGSGEKSRLGTPEARGGGCVGVGVGAGSGVGFGGVGGVVGPFFTKEGGGFFAMHRIDCANARRGTDLVKAASIPNHRLGRFKSVRKSVT